MRHNRFDRVRGPAWAHATLPSGGPSSRGERPRPACSGTHSCGVVLPSRIGASPNLYPPRVYVHQRPRQWRDGAAPHVKSSEWAKRFACREQDQRWDHRSSSHSLRRSGLTKGAIGMTGEKGLVVVTGASGGIGYEPARLFARDGWPLLLAARSGDKLTAFARELSDAHHVPVADARWTWRRRTPPTGCSRRRSGRAGRRAPSSTTPASAATAGSPRPTRPACCRWCRSTSSP